MVGFQELRDLENATCSSRTTSGSWINTNHDMMIWHEMSNVVMNILNNGFCHFFAASVEATSTMGWTGLMLWLAAICRFYKSIKTKTL